MKYFKLDKDKREIIIDKYKKYNVNIDILNLIIDLKCENDRLNNIINELEEYLNQEIIEWQDVSDLWTKAQVQEDRIVLDKIKELKDDNK